MHDEAKFPRTQDYAAPIWCFVENNSKREKRKKKQKNIYNVKVTRNITWKHDASSLQLDRPRVHASNVTRQKSYFSFRTVDGREWKILSNLPSSKYQELTSFLNYEQGKF